jgi:hypothetical protein
MKFINFSDPALMSSMDPRMLHAAGPGARARLRWEVPPRVLAIMPRSWQMAKSDGPGSVAAKFWLAKIKHEGKYGYIWAYLKPEEGPQRQPMVFFRAEIMVPGAPGLQIIPVRSDNARVTKPYLATSKLLPLVGARSVGELLAFVAYAFLDAAHDVRYGLGHHVPIHKRNVKDLLTLCSRPEFEDRMREMLDELDRNQPLVSSSSPGTDLDMDIGDTLGNSSFG